MKCRLNSLIGSLLILTGVLCACSPGKRPFLMVQMCLGNEQNLSAFKSILQSIAQSENMVFVDGSEETKKDLETIMDSQKIRGMMVNNVVINVGIGREGHFALMAGNTGLSDYEVVVGFSEDPNPVEARRFSTEVVDRLKNQWNVEVVSSGQGAIPMEICKKHPELQ